jgi:hypothetical protein
MLASDQYVLMPRGKRRLISRILFDDFVVTHLNRERPVLNRWSSPFEGIAYSIHAGGGLVTLTGDHPLLLHLEEDVWQPAESVVVGDVILGIYGYATVTGKQSLSFKGLMYNLSVAEDNSFCCGGICVHNGER